ncbi:MAG: hypothetical protein U9Q73_00440 [Nanoarchaeota archaeon]|nr:hypothetical protein [Nanoarchaeota archaeon]
MTLFTQRREMSTKEVAREAGFTLRQVTQATPHLLNRNMIIKTTKDDGGRGPKRPYIKLRDIPYIERYLSGRGIL